MLPTTVPPEILAAHGLSGEAVAPLGRGRINGTFRVGDRVLQVVNALVFPEAERVMANLVRILDHLGRKGATPLRILPDQAGRPWLRDAQGHLWRAFPYFAGTRTVEGRATPEEARTAAAAFGAYLRSLADLPVEALTPVIPGFHDTARHRQAFEAARAADPQGRARELTSLEATLRDLEPLTSALADPAVPRRIAHDDTKLNNVLIESATGAAFCVVDLDTTQPGSWLADFGDMARSACNPLGEEGSDLPEPDLAVFQALAEGFLREVGPLLAPAERVRLAVAPAVLAFELGLRFLTDHLEGDRIFRAPTPGDNLRRGAMQWALAQAFLQRQGQMESLVTAALRG
jgi:Ser/Thr protein kinase RdoA (MazF antagonist)